MRTLLTVCIACILLGSATIVVWGALRRTESERALAEVRAINADMAARLAEHERMVERLSRARRVARIEVRDQSLAPDGRVLETALDLVEIGDDGRELARQRFAVPGGVVFVDALTVKFDPADVALGHPLRGRTIVLLRRIYSELMPPAEGFAIDTPGAVPPAYGSGDGPAYERAIWDHFWQLATDPVLAGRMGVRVAQGEAVYKPMQVGQTFDLDVDAVGGLNLVLSTER